MILVIEGPDGAGKTTLLDEIADKLVGPVTRIGCGPPANDAESEYRSLVDRVLQLNTHVLIDRSHLGESVYGPVLRGKARVDAGYSCLLDMRLIGAGAILAYADVPYEVNVERLMRRDGGVPDSKSGASVKNLQSVRDQYDHVLALRPWWTRINMMDAPNVADVLIREAGRRTMRAIPSFIGNRDTCTHIFAGENLQELLFNAWVHRGVSDKFAVIHRRDVDALTDQEISDKLRGQR